MKKLELRRIVGHVVLAAMPTLALTTACRTTGEATYVVRSNGRTCHDACATLAGANSAQAPWRVSDVMECVEAAEVQTPTSGSETTDVQSPVALTTPVAVCRMRTHYMGGIGRRPEGLVVSEARGAHASGAFFTRMEQLERAAVLAFARTEAELRAFGAPGHLVRDVIRARREEEVHVRLAARWRERFGGARASIAVSPGDARDLEALAHENATEGRVHETWGAVLAAAHARGATRLHMLGTAADEWCARTELRALVRDLDRIAADEASHAALSHRLDPWARRALSRDARARLDRARALAIEEARASVEDDYDDALAAIGWPDRPVRAALRRDRNAPRVGHAPRGERSMIGSLAKTMLLGALLATALGLAPRASSAQSAPGDTALAGTVTGLEGALGTYVLAMPWRGFWHTEPDGGDLVAILGGLVAGIATGVDAGGLVAGHPERAELVSVVSGAGLGAALGIAILGGLYNLLVDFDRLAVSLVYGVPILLAMTAGLIAGLVHYVTVGDAPAMMISRLRVEL
jgi:hypothetical protein